jgi:hypothetical protein
LAKCKTEEDETGQSARGRGQQFSAIDGGWLLLTPDEPFPTPGIETPQSRMERLMQMRNAAIIRSRILRQHYLHRLLSTVKLLNLSWKGSKW